MNLSRFSSLRANIIVVVVLASSLAVGLFTVLITFVNTRSSIDLQDSRLAVLADVIGQNSTAALDFSDHRAAADVLEALRREPPVVSACLYDARGAIFSEYQRSAGAAACPRQLSIAASKGSSIARWCGVSATTLSLSDRSKSRRTCGISNIATAASW